MSQATLNPYTYESVLRRVLCDGVKKKDRTGTGTVSTFGHQIRYDLQQGFPLVTTKRVHFKSVAYELLWFLSGDTNVRWLQERGVSIWDEWADPDGELGPVYGHQWRNFGGHLHNEGRGWQEVSGVDQIAAVIDGIRTDPDGRRHLVSAWDPVALPQMALPPCHYSFQFYVSEDRLSCLVNQRSADMFLGVPFNLASYALLTHMVAQQTALGVGELIWSGGDCHIYNSHMEQVREQLGREPRPLPTIALRHKESIFDYEYEDIEIAGYDPYPAIPAPVAV